MQQTKGLLQRSTRPFTVEATFNIQNYGVSKASKSAVLEALAITIDRSLTDADENCCLTFSDEVLKYLIQVELGGALSLPKFPASSCTS